MAPRKRTRAKVAKAAKTAKVAKVVRKEPRAEGIKRICNVVPSKGTEKDWKFEDALASGALGAVAAPPASVDLRHVWMASKESDEYVQRPESFVEEAGTSLKAAMDVCRKFGVATMAMLPFNIATLMYTGTENAL